MNFTKTLALLMLSLLFTACGDPEHITYGDGTGGGQGGKDAGAEVIKYEAVKTQVLDAKCTGCHGAGGRLVDLSSLEALMARPGLVVPGQPDQSRLYTVLAQGIMPPRGTLPNELQQIVFNWILQGALP